MKQSGGINGKYVVAGFTVIVLAFVGTFVYFTISNKNRILEAVTQMKANPPVLEHPAGAMVLVPGAPGFYIDRNEVTVATFLGYCERAGRPVPSGISRGSLRSPVTGLTSAEKLAFCSAVGKRLPTPSELSRMEAGAGFRCAKDASPTR